MAAEWPIAGAPRTAVLLAVVTALGLIAAFANGLPVLLQWIVGLVALFVGIRGVGQLVRPNISTLSIERRRLRVRQAAGQCLSGRVSAAFVSPLFVGLSWRPENSRWPRSLGIFREQMAPEDFRRLSAQLRRGGEA